MTIIAALGVTTLLILGIKYFLQGRSEMVLQAAASLVIVVPFLILGRKLHQDSISYLVVMSAAVLQNLGLYETSPFGIKFEYYMHFLGGFTIGLIADRIFLENLPRAKRFALMPIWALGAGAVWEIAQWLYGLLLPDAENFRADGMWDCMVDMISNGLGGTTMGLVTLFRTRVQR